MSLVAPSCPRCGQDVPPESRFCLHCGKRLHRKSGVHGSVPERLQRALGPDYEVRGEIGRGGFGVVYSVRDLALDRMLAVKVIRPELVAADVVVARFQREARIVAQLNHPNVLGVIFAGEAEGLVYCGMRQVTGDTLRERLRRDGPMPVSRALRVFGEVAQGLAHAHQKGIVHRDVKPANIMLDRDGNDRAVLLDFGIAKGLSVGNGKLSVSGQVVGSLEYMSPERRAGAKDIDARSDVYSMGVVGFQMLTSRFPPGVDTTAQQRLDAPLHDSLDVRTLRPDVPEAFARTLERCLSPSLDGRPASALEAAQGAGVAVEA